MIANIKHGYTKAGAAITAFALTATPASAQTGGGTTVQSIGENMSTQLETVPTVLSWMAYLCGAGLGMAGVFKLRQHVDNPTQVSMKDGLIRLGAGGGLIALPVIISAAGNFAAGDGGDTLGRPALESNY